jgi:hypothetical protein
MMNNDTLQIELQYFPTIVSYSALIDCKYVDFGLYESYRKASFRNRCLIAGPNGVIALSIPIVGGRGLKAAYRDVRIDHGIPWRRRHFQAIRSSYGKSPFFGHYGEGLSRLYERQMDWLVDWNLACMDWVDQAFGVVSARQVVEGDAVSGSVADRRDRDGPRNHQSGGSGPFPKYPQMFEERGGFQPNLSVLDLVMSMGRRGLDALIRGKG